MSESNTRAEIVEVMARALATEIAKPAHENLDEVPSRGEAMATCLALSRAALTALESSGMAVVPRRALEQIVNLSDCGFAVDVAEQALAASPYGQTVVKDTTQ